MLELALGPYAVGRFLPPVKSTETARLDAPSMAVHDSESQSAEGADSSTESERKNLWSRLFVRAPAGPLRLADGQLAGQVGWLVPLAAMGLVASGFLGRFRKPLSPAHLALLLWLGWTLTYGVVYSFAGGIMHLYYLATVEPPLAALAGIGVVSLWNRYLQKGWRQVLLPATLLLTMAWQVHIEASALGWNLNQAKSLVSGLLHTRFGD